MGEWSITNYFSTLKENHSNSSNNSLKAKVGKQESENQKLSDKVHQLEREKAMLSLLNTESRYSVYFCVCLSVCLLWLQLLGNSSHNVIMWVSKWRVQFSDCVQNYLVVHHWKPNGSQSHVHIHKIDKCIISMFSRICTNTLIKRLLVSL